MMKGQIIFLTGVSSAGKTSLAKALQRRLGNPFFWISKDMIRCDMAPESFDHIRWPDQYEECSLLFIQTIKLFSDMGKNVVADSVQLEEAFRAMLSENPALYVHVTCGSIDELRRRERARGDRDIGQAERQLQLFHPPAYDMTVDTFSESLDSCVDKICERLLEQIGET